MHLLMTGPIDAKLTCADGTVVDVTPQVIEVDSPERAAEVAHLIGLHYEKHGHPHVDGDFVYERPAPADENPAVEAAPAPVEAVI